jgi:hypothetical protein
MKVESSVKQVAHSQQSVYNMLSDMNNVAKLKDKVDEVAGTDSQAAEMKDKLKDLSFDADSISVNISPVGNVSMHIVEREEPKMVKFESVNSPLSFKFWIQMLPVEPTTSKIRLTIDADVPFFAKGMVEKPLKEGIEKIAEALTVIPYED